MLIRFGLVVSNLVLCAAAVANVTLENGNLLRCALDVGSGSTKLKLAEVDPARQTVVRLLHEGTLKVGYKAGLTPDRKIPEALIADGIGAIWALRAKAFAQLGGLPAPVCRGVATAVFRESANGADVVKRLAAGTGSVIRIISQDEEARLGFVAGVSRVNSPATNVVVWDIGAASMQMTALDPEKPAGDPSRFLVYQGKLASETFKTYVMEQIQRPTRKASPNPISESDALVAENYVRSFARGVTLPLRKRLADPSVTVVGIGSVLVKSVADQIGLGAGRAFSVADLDRALDARRGWDDAKIGGKFAPTQIVNLFLVKGYMEELNIEKLLPADVDLTDGILLRPDGA